MTIIEAVNRYQVGQVLDAQEYNISRITKLHSSNILHHKIVDTGSGTYDEMVNVTYNESGLMVVQTSRHLLGIG
jgi:hypothetical protein